MMRGIHTPPDARLHPVALIENEEAIQSSLMEVINAIARNSIDLRRADLILKALHIAVKNSRRVRFDRDTDEMVQDVPDYPAPAHPHLPHAKIARVGTAELASPARPQVSGLRTTTIETSPAPQLNAAIDAQPASSTDTTHATIRNGATLGRTNQTVIGSGATSTPTDQSDAGNGVTSTRSDQPVTRKAATPQLDPATHMNATTGKPATSSRTDPTRIQNAASAAEGTAIDPTRPKPPTSARKSADNRKNTG
jgi:hypothetical protein